MPSEGPTTERLCQAENLAMQQRERIETLRCEQPECEEEKEDCCTQMSLPLPTLHAFSNVCGDNAAASTPVPAGTPSLQEEPFFGNFFASEQPLLAPPLGVLLEQAQTSSTLTQHPERNVNSGPSNHKRTPRAPSGHRATTPRTSNMVQGIQARTRPRPDAHVHGLPCTPRKQRRSRFRAPTLECIDEKVDHENEDDSQSDGAGEPDDSVQLVQEKTPVPPADQVEEEKDRFEDFEKLNAQSTSVRRHIRAQAVPAADINSQCLSLSHNQLLNVLSLQLASDRRVFCPCLTAAADGRALKSCSLCWAPEQDLGREFLAQALGRHWLKYQSWQGRGLACTTNSKSVEQAFLIESGKASLHPCGPPALGRRMCNAWSPGARCHGFMALARGDHAGQGLTPQSASSSSTSVPTFDASNLAAPNSNRDQNMDGSRHGLRRRPGSLVATPECLEPC